MLTLKCEKNPGHGLRCLSNFGKNDPECTAKVHSDLDSFQLRELWPVFAAPALLAAVVESVVIVEERVDDDVDIDGPCVAVRR